MLRISKLNKINILLLMMLSLSACNNPLGSSTIVNSEFHPGIASTTSSGASKLIFISNSDTTAAGVNFADQPVIQIQNINNEPVTTATHAITLTVYDGASCTGSTIAAGAGTWAVTTNPVTAIAGEASFAGVKVYTTTALSIKASAAGLTSDCTDITITPGAVNAAHSTFALNDVSLANGVDMEGVITLFDIYDNPVPGITVGMSSDRGATDTIGANTTTGADGAAAITINSLTTGRAHVTATDIDDALTIGVVTSVNYSKIFQLSSGSMADHFCAVIDDGSAGDKPIKCWGSNEYGQVGIGTSTAWEGIDNEAFQGVFVATGKRHTCAIDNLGDVYCWGDGRDGQLGTGLTTVVNAVSTKVIGLPASATSLALGTHHSCALLSNSRIYCWGDNTNGKIGFGANSANYVTAKIVSGLVNASAIVAGDNHTCAIESSLPYCWGDNSMGQLGVDAGTTESNVPVAVDIAIYTPGMTIGSDIADSIATGEVSTCAIRNIDKAVLCWGKNLFGETGDHSALNTTYFAPHDVSSLENGETATTLIAGKNHYCVKTSGGSDRIQCWGDNQYGQDGRNPSVASYNPRPLTVTGFDASGIASLSSAAGNTCVLLNSGAVQCFGDDSNNQFNDSANGNGYLPLTLSGIPF